MKINRRDFLKGLTGLGVGAVAAFSGAKGGDARLDLTPDAIENIVSPTTSITIPTRDYTITNNCDSTGAYTYFNISSAATSAYVGRCVSSHHGGGGLCFSTASSAVEWGT